MQALASRNLHLCRAHRVVNTLDMWHAAMVPVAVAVINATNFSMHSSIHDDKLAEPALLPKLLASVDPLAGIDFGVPVTP